MKLTKDQKGKLKEIKIEFIRTLKRLIENPAKFELIIESLKQIEVMHKAYFALINPYIENYQIGQSSKNLFGKTGFSFGQKNNIKKILGEISVILFDQDVVVLLNSLYKKHQILGLNIIRPVSPRMEEVSGQATHKQSCLYKFGFLPLVCPKLTHNYEIKLETTSIYLHSLEDYWELQNAKSRFAEEYRQEQEYTRFAHL